MIMTSTSQTEAVPAKSKIEWLHNPAHKRNICIMAHVDHGKTTLADALVATNDHINTRQAGKIRYMDSRPDEMERGITMKSSCVTLTYQRGDTGYVVNLVDSPGHVDFSSEVSTAVRLCDGTIIVVDVVEGVCAQTKVVLRQAFAEGIKPILVLNKIDRLVLERKMEPYSAYCHIANVLEQVNAFMAELYNMDAFEREVATTTDDHVQLDQSVKLSRWGMAERDDSDLYFSPESGNVIFGSAYDGWGFRLEDFAKKFSSKFGFEEQEFCQALWGDYYISTKGGKKVLQQGARAKQKDPLFVSVILNNIFEVYQSIVLRMDLIEMEKIAKKLNVKLPFYVSRSKDNKSQCSYILSQWLPLATSVFDCVVDHLPSAADMSLERATKLMSSVNQPFDTLPEATHALRPHFQACSAASHAPLIVFVSKMYSIDKRTIEIRKKVPQFSTEAKHLPPPDVEALIEDNEQLVGFARVFSGTLKVGAKVYVLSPKHNPKEIVDLVDNHGQISEENLEKCSHVTTAEITHLYLLMGRKLNTIQTAPAGSMVAIGGLTDSVIKSATLASTAMCPTFTELTHHSQPILRVAVQVENIQDLQKLSVGLDKLYQADPCVEIERPKSGEHILVTAGEVHLQRCMDDLENLYAKVKVTHTDPIVPFRETIILPPSVDRLNEAIKKGLVDNKDKNGQNEEELTSVGEMKNNICSMRVRCLPLPEAVTQLLERNHQVIQLLSLKKKALFPHQTIHHTLSEQHKIDHFKQALRLALSGDEWQGVFDNIWSFGPNYSGANLLVNRVPGYQRPSVWDTSEPGQGPLAAHDVQVIDGFQIALKSGPLCDEPMMGVAFFLEQWEFEADYAQALTLKPLAIIHMSQQVHHLAFSHSHQRLMCAMYSCEINVNAMVIGKMYNLLGKRHGTVTDGDSTEGSTSWNVTAYLPVIESLNFAKELMTATSGEAMPQLVFSHWHTIEIDPEWEPQTEEELTHWGQKADKDNLARKYINLVRRRKGLATDDKIVEFAEKQRTLTKNK